MRDAAVVVIGVRGAEEPDFFDMIITYSRVVAEIGNRAKNKPGGVDWLPRDWSKKFKKRWI